jgi:hypothetical protein
MRALLLAVVLVFLRACVHPFLRARLNACRRANKLVSLRACAQACKHA